MLPERSEFHDHQVGITNAQEKNPNIVIAEMTQRMKVLFALERYEQAVCVAFSITAMGKENLRQTFCRHGVVVQHLDHEVFGIYRGTLEPSYDVHVEGATSDVLAAAKEFGKRHAQEMVLVARRLQKNKEDVRERLGITIKLKSHISAHEAVRIADIIRSEDIDGATFVPKRQGTIIIFNTEPLGMTNKRFENAVNSLVSVLRQRIYWPRF